MLLADDRRMIKNAMQKDWNIEMEDDSLTQCVRRFGVPMPERAGEGERHASPPCSSLHILPFYTDGLRPRYRIT